MQQGACTAATVVVVLLLGGCCFEAAQGSRPWSNTRPQPRPEPGVFYPYYCPHDITLTKLKMNQTESGYVQYTEYAIAMPSLTSFTMHYWFNLADTTTTTTMFNYKGRDFGLIDIAVPVHLDDDLTVQLEAQQKGLYQYFSVKINQNEVSRVPVSQPIRKGEWHHALHTWDSNTGVISHFLDGELLPGRISYKSKGYKIREGGIAVSGQHQSTERFMGMDQGEGLNGWFTLFHLSAKPLGTSHSSAATKAKLAYQCSGDMGGDLINWTTTPRKGYGGVTETPSDSKACGRF